MTEIRTTRKLTITIAGIVVLGVFSLMAGLPLGAVVVLASIGLALANRGRLVRAIRSPDSSLRTRRLRTSALSAGALAACVIAYVIVTWDGEASTPGLLIPTLFGTSALVGAVSFLAAGLLTPRSTHQPGR